MRLEDLYRVRFSYPESWVVELEGGWEQHLMIAEGRCEGQVSGRFRGVNFPQRRTPSGPFRPDFRAVIDTDDGATIMVEWHGYGRAYPAGRRQVVGSVLHLVTARSTAASTTSSACASARFARRTVLLSRVLIW